jgi:hypothetical protein
MAGVAVLLEDGVARGLVSAARGLSVPSDSPRDMTMPATHRMINARSLIKRTIFIKKATSSSDESSNEPELNQSWSQRDHDNTRSGH